MSYVFSNELVMLLLNHFQLIQKASSRCTCILPQIQMQWLEKSQDLLTIYMLVSPIIRFYIQLFHWLNVLGSFGSENTGLSLCLCVCLSVCLCMCVCVSALVWRNHWADFNETIRKKFSICLVVCVCVSAY